MITSPPYFALRDYGTGRWEGGDPACEHRIVLGGNGAASAKQVTSAGTQGYQARDFCKKCGAHRVDRQIGLEADQLTYVDALVAVFGEIWRVLRDDGTVWLNLGDSYASGNGIGDSGRKGVNAVVGNTRREVQSRAPITDGIPSKNLCLIPERVALALQAAGWTVRAKPPWIKYNPMPESVCDRPTTAHESIFLLSKRADYFFDAEAVRSPMAPGSTGRYTYAFGGEKSETFAIADKDGMGVRTRPIGFRDPTAGRNRRTSDWFVESLDEAIAWHEAEAAHLRGVRDRGGMLAADDGTPLAIRVASQPWSGSHFATFPERLVRPMVLASTSQAGACPACGAGWVRETEPDGGDTEAIRRPKHLQSSKSTLSLSGNGSREWAERGSRSRTLGWRPGCSCDAGPPRPCIVFDPFVGAGTVPLTANALGRHGIGLDLNRDYLRMADRRISRPHAPAQRPARAKVAGPGQRTLFS